MLRTNRTRDAATKDPEPIEFKSRRSSILLPIGFFILFKIGCNTGPMTLPTSLNPSPSITPSATPTTAVGVRAAQIIFQASSTGSFNSPSTAGTVASPGSGLQAIRLFNPDGTVLASNGTADSSWPKWLTSFEIGISGSSNSSSGNSNCANFASSSESSSANCQIGSSGTTTTCGAPSGQFRVSEVDCTLGSPVTSTGTGGGSDGVYIRAVFDRNSTNLGLAENILVVLQYTAAALNPAPANPTSCFDSTTRALVPENCSDFVWRAYLKRTTTEVVNPFLMLMPPFYTSLLGSVQASLQASGTMITTKQFILPLAADPTLTTLQISRTTSNFPNSSTLQTYCTPGGNLPGNSPLCAGVIFYSLTFYRI